MIYVGNNVASATATDSFDDDNDVAEKDVDDDDDDDDDGVDSWSFDDLSDSAVELHQSAVDVDAAIVGRMTEASNGWINHRVLS